MIFVVVLWYSGIVLWDAVCHWTSVRGLDTNSKDVVWVTRIIRVNEPTSSSSLKAVPINARLLKHDFGWKTAVIDGSMIAVEPRWRYCSSTYRTVFNY